MKSVSLAPAVGHAGTRHRSDVPCRRMKPGARLQ